MKMEDAYEWAKKVIATPANEEIAEAVQELKDILLERGCEDVDKTAAELIAAEKVYAPNARVVEMIRVVIYSIQSSPDQEPTVEEIIVPEDEEPVVEEEVKEEATENDFSKPWLNLLHEFDEIELKNTESFVFQVFAAIPTLLDGKYPGIRVFGQDEWGNWITFQSSSSYFNKVVKHELAMNWLQFKKVKSDSGRIYYRAEHLSGPGLEELMKQFEE